MDRNKILTNRAFYKQITENDPAAQARALQLCKQDIVFWVNHFCWCFEPRSSAEFPIILFDYQNWALREWVEHFDRNVGKKKDDLLIEKSRDMGITWLILYLFIWYWLFRPQSNFLISSFREDEVDIADNMSTLFPKIRFVLDRLPEWMLPAGFVQKKHATYMTVINPENKSLIRGSAPVANYGRSGRWKCVFFDELAFWPYAEASWKAAGHSTNIRIALSTPNGPDGAYARLANDSENNRIIYPQHNELYKTKDVQRIQLEYAG